MRCKRSNPFVDLQNKPKIVVLDSITNAVDWEKWPDNFAQKFGGGNGFKDWNWAGNKYPQAKNFFEQMNKAMNKAAMSFSGFFKMTEEAMEDLKSFFDFDNPPDKETDDEKNT